MNDRGGKKGGQVDKKRQGVTWRKRGQKIPFCEWRTIWMAPMGISAHNNDQKHGKLLVLIGVMNRNSKANSPTNSTLTHLFLIHPFSTPLITSENCKVEKGCIGNEWVNLQIYPLLLFLVVIIFTGGQFDNNKCQLHPYSVD